jgi:DNA-binding GntR family transcriptional regulator
MRLSETELADEMGTSRTPLRRVLARLEDEGLVRSVHGVGTFVTDVNIQDLTQTYQLRIALTELVGQLDPVKPDEQLLSELDALARQAVELAKMPEPRAFAQLNMAFFKKRLLLTENGPLRAICERLYLHTARIWLQSSFASKIDLQQEARIFAREAEDVMEALRIGDSHAAAMIQRSHLSMSFTRLLQQG